MVWHANTNQKNGGLSVSVADKTNFDIRTITRGKWGHFIMIKGTIQ